MGPQPTTRAQSPLETVPLEVLNKIFAFVCQDNIDLCILHTSKTLHWRLRSHLVVQALQSFCTPEEWSDLFGIALDVASPAIDAPIEQSEESSHGETSTVLASTSLQRAYSTPGLLKCIQIVMLKRIVLQAWTPFLRRDGVEASRMSSRLLQKFLDSTVVLKSAATVPAAHKDIVFVDSSLKYSWTRLHVLPAETRVVIRDQLFNTKIETQVPFLQEIWC